MSGSFSSAPRLLKYFLFLGRIALEGEVQFIEDWRPECYMSSDKRRLDEIQKMILLVVTAIGAV